MTRLTLHLHRNESRWVRVVAGSRLTPRGQVQLAEAPRWLGERVVRIETALGDGVEHTMTTTGWISLQALTESTIHCDLPMKASARWFARCRMIWPARAWHTAT